MNSKTTVAMALTASFLLGVATHAPTRYAVSEFRAGAALTLVNRAAQDCREPLYNRTSRIGCLRNRLTPVVSAFGVRLTMDMLGRALAQADSKGAALTNCHDIAHVIGKIGVTNVDRVGSVLSECTRTCGDGCAHGVVEGYIARGGSLESAVTQLCKPTDYSCFHGIGHGIATTVGDTKKSLLYCDAIPKAKSRDQCAYGIFMELYESSTFGHALLPLPRDVRSLCTEIPERYRDVCYSKAGIHAYKISGSIEEAAKACSSVGNPGECRYLLGVLLYWQYQGDPAGLVAACARTGDSSGDCARGVLFESVNIDPRGYAGFTFCANAEKHGRKDCFRQLSIAIGNTIGTDSEQDRIDSWCTGIKLTDPQTYSACGMGLGRGIAVRTDAYTTQGAAAGIRTCERLTNDPGVCVNGLLEEIAAYKSARNSNDTIDCEGLPERYQPTCYFWNMTIMRGYGADIAQLGSECRKLSVQRNREECYTGIGHVVTRNPLYTHDSVESDCSRLPTQEGKAFCVIQAMRVMYVDGKKDPRRNCDSLVDRFVSDCHEAGQRYNCHVMLDCRGYKEQR